MKENNLQKKPRNSKEYANFFLLDEKGKKRDFSNISSVCLITIGYAETLWILLQEFADKDITIIDRKSEIDFIETLKKLHKRNDIRIVQKIEVETDKAVLSTILNLNMFDFVSINPPYGKSSSLSKKIVNSLLENKVAKEMVVLAPKNTCKDENISKEVDKAFLIKENPFEDAAFAENNLCVFHIGKEKGNMDWVSFYLTPKSVKLYKVVQAYNKTHAPCYTVVDGTSFKKKFQCKIPELSKNVWAKYKEHLRILFKDRLEETFSPKSEGIFVKTIWTAENGVHFGDAHDTLYNYGKKDWDKNWEKDRRVDLFIFPNDQYKNNFRDWWYSITKTSKTKVRKGLTNAFLDLNRDYVGAGAECYLETFPNLDWSHPWTDKEILKEIGLPEDFLEKE